MAGAQEGILTQSREGEKAQRNHEWTQRGRAATKEFKWVKQLTELNDMGVLRAHEKFAQAAETERSGKLQI